MEILVLPDDIWYGLPVSNKKVELKQIQEVLDLQESEMRDQSMSAKLRHASVPF